MPRPPGGAPPHAQFGNRNRRGCLARVTSVAAIRNCARRPVGSRGLPNPSRVAGHVNEHVFEAVRRRFCRQYQKRQIFGMHVFENAPMRRPASPAWVFHFVRTARTSASCASCCARKQIGLRFLGIFRDAKLPGVIRARRFAHFLAPRGRTRASRFLREKTPRRRPQTLLWLFIKIQARFTEAAQFRAALIDRATLLTGLDHRAVFALRTVPCKKGRTHSINEARGKWQPFRGCPPIEQCGQGATEKFQSVAYTLGHKNQRRRECAAIAGAVTRC